MKLHPQGKLENPVPSCPKEVEGNLLRLSEQSEMISQVIRNGWGRDDRRGFWGSPVRSVHNAEVEWENDAGWWFQKFFILTHTWGNDPNLTHIFQMG